MSSPYGPPGGYPQWGQSPQGPGMPPGGMQPAVPGYPQQGGYAPQQQPPQQQPPQRQPPQRPPQQPYGYGQQQYPQGGRQLPQSGGYGRYAQPPRKKRSALPWVLSGIGAVVVIGVVLVLGFVVPGWFVQPVFDSASVEKGVTQTLKNSYGLSGVGEVSCPDGEPVQVSHRFDCKVSIDSQPRTVTVTVKNDKGVYEVGHPK